MNFDPNKFPAGLSWGVRGLRIGKSAYGNWWVSLGLPFGFRYTWRLGKSYSNTQQSKLSEVTNNSSFIPAQEQAQLKSKSHNQEIIEQMNKKP